ncbi:unnamed protein product [Prorocentrum cordatum]|uniref:Tyr recombinase domain-containing protein n=1 Tax=Prorocentrum cordatum TaxID=2364126 RepID=A0ABN9UMI9_9DINO|nr:unnamed protein product [Polarella glacialis]
MLQKLSEGTRAGYEGGWRLWVAVRQAQGLSPWLPGRDREERLADEEALINFAVLLARVVGRTEGTIKQKLFAVRYAHLVAGYSDPLLHRGRLWSTLARLKRWQGPETKRKKPVTPAMLEWLRGFLQQEAKLPEEDAVVIWAAIVTAFFFLLRASEYLLQDGRSWSFERVLHGEDVEPRKDGKRVPSFQDADEMVIYIKGSKTDQLNVGTVRNHYRAGTTLCPIAAMERLQAHHPQRIKGHRGTAAPFPLGVQHFLTVAGLAAGLSREEIGSHSLRIGGATAMYHVTEDLSRVRQFGRWQSDAFHGYLWESHEPMKGISGKMARDTSSLTNPAKDSGTPTRAFGTGQYLSAGVRAQARARAPGRGAGRSGGRGADGGAKHRPVPSASDGIFGPWPEASAACRGDLETLAVGVAPAAGAATEQAPVPRAEAAILRGAWRLASEADMAYLLDRLGAGAPKAVRW